LEIEPRNMAREIELVGHGAVRDRATSDLWVWEGVDGKDYAITGTWGAEGHAYIWDVTDASNMVMIDAIHVDARTVNDVKVSEDGRIAVISREGASNRRNGLVILDVSDLASGGARILATFDDQLTGGVHNLYINQNHIYALSAGSRYDIINIEDPTNPYRVGRYQHDSPGSSIHDVWVANGSAFSSNWSDGVVAVDVGGGGQGGSPNNPVLLGSYAYPSGWNHAAFPYWSESAGKFYMFAGDEAGRRGNTPGYEGEAERMNGWIHVIEWDEWGDPRKKEYYDYMLSYSPYDNVEAKEYPNMLVTTGYFDSQVQYWEPLKWVAKLRSIKTGETILYLHANMDAGHGGKSGRFRRYREVALEYAFMFDLVGITR